MSRTVEQFVADVAESELLSEGEVRAILEELPAEKRTGDAQALARELVRRKKVSNFQASAIYQGKVQSLSFGNYLVLEKLGEGGMGMVFKARHRRLNRIVALKVLPPAATKSLEAVKRFHREVEAAARLTHPNIVAAYDAGEEHGVHFLVMEYVAGQDLSRLVKQDGPLSVDRATSCILQAARGLEHAHVSGVVHRDIKPANLLLDDEGTVKILDMGLARLSDADTVERQELTHTGNIMGTIDYMSPEQALQTKTADARADIYSLGCALHFLVAGRVVFEGDTMMAKLLAHREQAIPPLRSPLGTVPPALDAVFRRMIAKNVADRYQSMGEVIRDLEGCLSGKELVASATGVGRQPGDSVTSTAGSRTSTEFDFGDPHVPQFSDETRAGYSTTAVGKKSRSGKSKSSYGLVWAGGVVALLVIVGVLWAMFGGGGSSPRVEKRQAASKPTRSKSSAEAPLVPADDFKRERQALNWLVQVGNGVRAESEFGQPIEVVDFKDIPNQNFYLTEISIKPEVINVDSGMKYLSGLNYLAKLNLSGTTVTDRGLSQLKDLPRLTELYATGTQISDPGLQQIGKFASLKVLNLDACQSITVQGFAPLAQLKSLTYLALSQTQFDDDASDHLLGLRELISFGCNSTGITDDGLKKLCQLTQLEEFSIQGTQITDDGLKHLQALSSLKTLFLSGNRLTSQGLAHLRGLPQLSTLDLRGVTDAKVTTEGLLHLQAIPNLRALGVADMNLTDAEFESLQKALPLCEVSR